MMVVIFHFTRNTHFGDLIGKYGVTGVDLFFIISGYVIFMSLKKSDSWKYFIFNRFSRLFPTYWFIMTISTVFVILNKMLFNVNFDNIGATYLMNLTMIHKVFGFDDIDGSYWTLYIELLFYAFISIILYFNKVEKIQLYSLFFLGLCLIYNFIIRDLSYTLYFFLKNLVPLVNHFPFFLAGICFYNLKFNLLSKSNSRSQLVLIFLCLVVGILLFDNGGYSNNYLNRTEYTITSIFYFGIFFLFINNKLFFIVNQFTIRLGNISYTLYLIHGYIGSKFLIPILTKYYNFNIISSIIITTIFVVILASLITKFIEQPSIKWMRKLYYPQNVKSKIE